MTCLNGSVHQIGGQRRAEDVSDADSSVQPEHIPESTPLRMPNLVGSDLTAADYSALDARWSDRNLADSAHLRRVDSMTGCEIVGRRGGNYAGILIPYFLPGSDHVREHRLRRDQPDLESDASGNLKPRQKYLSPPGRSNVLYVVPGVGPALLNAPALPIIVTEGEFKTLALWRLANHGSPDRPRFLPWGFPRLQLARHDSRSCRPVRHFRSRAGAQSRRPEARSRACVSGEKPALGSDAVVPSV